jgi:hypothetical protein
VTRIFTLASLSCFRVSLSLLRNESQGQGSYILLFFPKFLLQNKGSLSYSSIPSCPLIPMVKLSLSTRFGKYAHVFTTEAQRTQRNSNLSFAGRYRQMKGVTPPAAKDFQ